MNKPMSLHFRVRTYEADYLNKVKVSSIFNYMQEAAAQNANYLGFGYDQLKPKGYYWILARVMVQMKGSVGFDEEFIVETWPKGTEKLFALRDFNFYNSNSQRIGQATTAWLMIDSSTGRPIIFDREEYKLPHFSLPPAIVEVPGKLEETDHKTARRTIQVSYTDIDVNHHVNNARYLDYIFDSFSEHDFQDRKLSSIQINYLKELKYGDILIIFHGHYEGIKNHTYIEGLNQRDQKVFQALIEWQDAKTAK